MIPAKADLIAQLRTRRPRVDMEFGGGDCPPLSRDAVAGIEARLGFALPALLVDVYATIANGGFGPGYGLLGLGDGGFTDDLGHTADALYLENARPNPNLATWDWPKGLLPISHMGCAIYHCVDCESQRMVIFEPSFWDETEPLSTALFDTGVDLPGWLTFWAQGGKPWDLFDDSRPLRVGPTDTAG